MVLWVEEKGVASESRIRNRARACTVSSRDEHWLCVGRIV
jgi:hypothetical protein